MDLLSIRPMLHPDLEELNGDNDGEVINHKEKTYYALFLLAGLGPFVVFSLTPIWVRYRKKRELREEKERSREEKERRLVMKNLAEPIREEYLSNLMKDYSMTLSDSDICDVQCDSDEEEGLSNVVVTIESCGEKQSLSLPSDNDGPTNDKVDEGSNDELPENDDIEMQRPIAMNSKEDEDRDDTSLSECDSSQSQHSIFCIPVPGQKVGNCGAEDDSETSELEMVPKRKAHSEGCVVCMNPFEVGQKITWSANPDCTHVFHHQCLLEWFDAVGKKKWKAETARQEGLERDDRDTETIKQQICDFPKQCPFCRRDYLFDGIQEAKDDSEDTTEEIDLELAENHPTAS